MSEIIFVTIIILFFSRINKHEGEQSGRPRARR
jgi:hypothetical protein